MTNQFAVPAPAPVSLPAAVAAVQVALNALAAVPGWSMGDADLLGGIEQVGVLSARVDAVRAGSLREVEQRGSVHEVGAPSVTAWLRGSLRFAPGAAAAQVGLAERLGSPRCAQVAAVLAAGRISTAHAHVITRTLVSLPDALDDTVLAEAQTTLVDQAARLDPTALRHAAVHLRAVLDPRSADDLARTEFEQVEHRTLTLTDTGDGWTWIRGQLDPEGAAIVRAALDPLSAPAPSTDHGPDPRRAPQRRADALVDLARRLLAAGELPTHGGIRPTLVVTIDLAALTSNTGAAHLPDGTRLSPATARKLACDAGIIPAVLGSNSEVLDLGRRAYRATPAQRTALTLRDHGCLNPRCNAPPTWCDIHHLVPFAQGGTTDLNTMALFCPRDHTKVHTGELLVTTTPGHPPTVTWIKPTHRKIL